MVLLIVSVVYGFHRGSHPWPCVSLIHLLPIRTEKLISAKLDIPIFKGAYINSMDSTPTVEDVQNSSFYFMVYGFDDSGFGLAFVS